MQEGPRCREHPRDVVKRAFLRSPQPTQCATVRASPLTRTTTMLRSLCAFAVVLLAMSAQAAERYVAITIDDLPYQRGPTLADVQLLTDHMLEQIRKQKEPVMGFVNESKLHDKGPEELAARTALLEQWLDAGAELGNHTYSHADINVVDFESYKQDVLKGGEITRPLLRARNQTLRYFRHPYLRTGKDEETKNALEVFLREHDYVVAPVTIDNDEWIYALAYDIAAERKDVATMRRLGQDYIAYMTQAFEFSEHVATQIFGRDIKHVLLIHVNTLNADYYDELMAMMKARGYKIVTLAEAMTDSAYQRQNLYVGPQGWSWLFRWSVGTKLDTSKAPQIPSYIRELSGIE